MVKLELLDEKLNLGKTKQYKLSIQASLDGFSFCCMDDNLKRFVALKSFAFEKPMHSYDELALQIQPIIDNDELFNKEFKEVKCMAISPMYTLIPRSFFVKENAFEYIAPIIPYKREDVDLFARSIDFNDSIVVFAIPRNLAGLLQIFHANIEFYSQAFPQITKQAEYKASFPSLLSLIIDGNLACLSLLNDGKLVINNTFAFESSSDLVYYTLLVLKESEIKPENTEVHIEGNITKGSQCYGELSRFLPNLAFEPVPKGYEYSYLFKNRAEHQFANLFKLTECE